MIAFLMATVLLASTPADDGMTREEALRGSQAPREILDRQVVVRVRYIDFEGRDRSGQLVVDRALATEVEAIFADLHRAKFPIERMTPIVAYDWDDHASMRANNTSAFNYRPIAGTRTLSHHARGRAIDINPRQNPHVGRDTLGFVYDPKAKGAITANSAPVRAFRSRGWKWGGDWRSSKDYMHFEKP